MRSFESLPSRSIRALVTAHRRTVQTQMCPNHKFKICGGLSLFLDMTRAFDTACRSTICNHLFDLGTPEHLIQLVASWHENTHYNLVFQGTTTKVRVGKGLCQGCKIAPLLWVIYMDRFLQMLAAKTGPEWIAEAVTLYADDVHFGCAFRSAQEFRTHLTNLGYALDCLESLQLSISYSKSFMLLRYTGTNPRPVLKGCIQRTSAGASLLVPRHDGSPTPLPLKNKGRYLGAVISYHSFEAQTWAHRKKAGWAAFNRVRAWLRNRQLPIAKRIYLWKTCVHSVLTYSLLSVHVTLPVLHEYQITVYQMIRMILGDHPYATHHTHQQVFHLYSLAPPLELLSALAMGLLRRIHRRDQLLQPDDFLRRLDWSHLHDVLALIQCIRQTAPEVPIALDPAAPVQTQALHGCQYCSFATRCVANLRRHLTTHHQHRQFRTSDTSPLDMSLQGKPQCSHCLIMFTTWNQFFIHVQRDCCQASHSGQALRSEPSPLPNVMIQPELELHAASQPFWPDLQQFLNADDWTALGNRQDVTAYLSNHCVFCGMWCNRFQEMHGHYKLYHQDQTRGSVAKGVQLSHILQQTSPCLLCGKTFHRVHSCPAALQVGALRLQMMDPEVRHHAERTCDICIQQFDDASQLYGHMSLEHGLTINDWCPSRDSQEGNDICRHCGASFESRSGLRRHITEGRCGSFDPLASPNPIDTTGKWGAWLSTGDFTALTAHQRLQLTTVCQFCGMKYMRTGHVVAHLLQSHGALWTASQTMLRFLLQAVMAKRGCTCNPQAHEVGLAHVCTSLRQIAMMLAHTDTHLFVPAQFTAAALSPALECLNQAALTHRLIDVLTERNFSQLWQDSLILQGLRSRCVLCGGHYKPAALMRHLLTMHPQTSAWATQIAFQLYVVMQNLQHQDYQCLFCQQVFNLPPDFDAPMSLDRLQTLHSHFVSSCPVVLQIACLLHPLDGRSDGSQRSSLDGRPLGAGTPAAGGPQAPRRKRRRLGEQAPQGSQRRRPGRRPSSQRDHDQSPPLDGPGAPEPRSSPTTTAPTGLLRYVCPKQRGRHHSPAHSDGQNMARPSSPAEGQHQMAHTADPSCGRPCDRAPSPGETSSGQQTGRASVGRRHQQRSSSPRRELGVPEVVTGNQTADPCSPSTGPHGEDAPKSSDIGGPAQVQQPCDQVPELAQRPGDNPMAASVEPSGFGRLGADARPLQQHDLDAPGDVGEAAQPSALKTGFAAPGNLGQRLFVDEQGQGENQTHPQAAPTELDGRARHHLRAQLLRLPMENAGSNLCYANSAFVSMLWAIMSRIGFQLHDWGARSPDLHRILLQADDTLFSLANASWFNLLVQGWNDDQDQADSAEFLHMLSSWMVPPALSNCWERRVQTGQKTELHDSGDLYMPLTLQFAPHMTDHVEVHLNTLLRWWSTDLGMQAGLTDPQDLLLLHIDRLVQNPMGDLRKCTAALRFEWTIDVPVLVGPSTGTAAYTVVAGISHQGHTQGGHYEAALRVFPEVSDLAQPSLWLHCDDRRTPARLLTLPEAFHQGITCLWLCKSECLELHRLPSQPTPAHSSEASLLALLQSQPDPEP